MEKYQKIQPIRVEATQETQNPASFIFLHGYGDDAEGFVNIAQQFQSAQKLPHLTWIFPTAPHNHDANSTAWYTPTSFTPIPVGRSSTTEDNTDDEALSDDYEDEILESSEYLCSLIDAEISKGVSPTRILIGGFSQGCAVSLLTALSTRHSGKIGGVIALSGYLPRGKKIREGRKGFKKEGGMKIFMAHGTRDMLVPMRVFRDAKKRVVDTVGEEAVVAKEYEGLSHAMGGAELRDMCEFMEGVVPP